MKHGALRMAGATPFRFWLDTRSPLIAAAGVLVAFGRWLPGLLVLAVVGVNLIVTALLSRRRGIQMRRW